MKQLRNKQKSVLHSMVKPALLALFILMGFGAEAQEYKTKLGNSSDKTVNITLNNSKIAIEGYDGDEVIIVATGYTPPPKRAEGLVPLYGGGPDNSGIGLSVKTEGNKLNIMKTSNKEVNYTFKLPRKVSLVCSEVNWQGDGITISGMEGEMEVTSQNSDVVLTNVAGPVVASSTSGNITIKFNKLHATKPSSVSAISGFVDITLPANSKADLKLKSISGDIYSDLDIVTSKKDKDLPMIGGEHNIDGTLNGGGPALNINAISGDIYLRKTK